MISYKEVLAFSSKKEQNKLWIISRGKFVLEHLPFVLHFQCSFKKAYRFFK